MCLLWVSRLVEPGRSQGGPSARINPQTPPAKGWPVSAAKASEGCWTPIPCALGAPRTPPLRSHPVPLRSTPPGRLGPRRRPPQPYSLAALSAAEAAAAPPGPRPQPAGSGFPLLARGSAPGVFPKPGPARDSPPPGCLRTPRPAAAREPGRWEPQCKSP